MIAFEKICGQMYDAFLSLGYPGIGGIADVGEEWAFIQAPKEKGGELPLGDVPTFVNKENGNTRVMVVDIPDMKLMNEGKSMSVPDRYKPRYEGG